MKRIRSVLYASDLSPVSRGAFETALDIATTLHAKLTILSVLPPLIALPHGYVDAVTRGRLDRQTRRWSAQQLERLATRARKAGIRSTAIILRDGNPADQIIRVCRATKSDLIVVGTHGRRGLPKFFLGSVAERVILMASCPVVSVRGK